MSYLNLADERNQGFSYSCMSRMLFFIASEPISQRSPGVCQLQVAVSNLDFQDIDTAIQNV